MQIQPYLRLIEPLHEFRDMESFEAEVVLECSQQTAFDFLIRPENIKRISPPEVGLYFLDAPEVLELGSTMTFKVRAMGVVRQATHEITAFDGPNLFTEKQIDGPLQHWDYDHIVEAISETQCRVIDRIQFLPPKGIAGLLMNKNRILDDLEEGFDHRHEQLEIILGKPE